jgi:2-keto-3-deoxy-L-rhamnonate aldolase RhmA
MPTAATFRSRLAAREPLYGAWSVIPSPLSARLLAAAGLDYVVIDLQHGGATEADLPAMTSAVRLAGATPIARVPAACAAAGKPAGVHATEGTTARRYREAGCTLITAGGDATAITRDTAAQFGLARA